MSRELEAKARELAAKARQMREFQVDISIEEALKLAEELAEIVATLIYKTEIST